MWQVTFLWSRLTWKLSRWLDMGWVFVRLLQIMTDLINSCHRVVSHWQHPMDDQQILLVSDSHHHAFQGRVHTRKASCWLITAPEVTHDMDCLKKPKLADATWMQLIRARSEIFRRRNLENLEIWVFWPQFQSICELANHFDRPWDSAPEGLSGKETRNHQLCFSALRHFQ